jgi:hypothetical protein
MMDGLPTQVLARLIKLLIWSDCLERFDEIAGKGLARRDDVYPLIADLIRAERRQRLDRLSLQHLVIAMPYTTQFNNAYYFGIKLPRLALIKGRGCEATEV